MPKGTATGKATKGKTAPKTTTDKATAATTGRTTVPVEVDGEDIDFLILVLNSVGAARITSMRRMISLEDRFLAAEAKLPAGLRVESELRKKAVG